MSDTVMLPSRVKALELANAYPGSGPADVVERAHAYHAFLSGSATAGAVPPKPATAGAKSGTVTKPGTTPPAAGAKPPTKPAAAKPPAAPAAAAKAPGGKYNQDQVRGLIREVAKMPGEGQQSAKDILMNDGGGVQTVSQLKPEHYDAVYEACQQVLSEAGGAGEAQAEFDPAA